MTTTTTTIKRPKIERVFGIIRVSEQGDREDERLHSPDNQLDAIKARCLADGMTLIDYDPEINVSGGLPLIRRPALLAAVLAVEEGRADVIVAPALDRLVRSRPVQDEILGRVQAAGGRLITLDLGEVTNGTPEQDFSTGIIGDVNELYRKQISAKTKRGHARAVELGRNIGPTPPGYVVGADRKLALDPPNDATMLEAFRMRANDATIQTITDYITASGIRHTVRKRSVPYTPPAVRKMLANRVYLGEIHHGPLQNLEAHEPIVDLDLFRRVQRKVLPGGRQSRSDHLLARQGVLRCGTCGSKMSLGHAGAVKGEPDSGWPFYRCGGYACDRKMSIGAEIVEQVVVEAVKSAIADVEGRASAAVAHQDAAGALDVAQAALDAAFRTFVGYEAESAARERLAELRQARDEAQVVVDQLGDVGASITIGAEGWDRLTLVERRDLIRATIEQVSVGPGRGADRVSVELLG